MSDSLAQARACLHDSKDIEAFANLMDGIGHEERVRVIRALKKKDQKAMWELSSGYRPISLEDMVATPASFVQVRHIGRNTLPVFTKFEKRFCRPETQGAREELMGYNWGGAQPLIGPGYFMAYFNENTKEVDIDYRLTPESKPDDWPEIKDNNSGLGKLVFGNMVDSLRKVSEHITIGSAARNGKPLGSWFVLCREA
jgi:hypothetical protein